MSLNIKHGIWVAWLLLFPVSSWLIFQQYPPSIAGHGMDIFTLFVLMCIVSSLPIIVNETPIFFTDGVSLAVFLAFGLFVEFALMQLVLIVLLVKLRVGKGEFFRFPMNSLMFTFISLVSAFVYFILGGKTGIIELNSVQTFIPIIGYIVTSFILNHIVIYFIKKYVYQRSNGFFTKDLIWEVLTSLIVIPVGIVLYLLYNEIGLLGIFFVGVPFISLAVILNLFHSSQKINKYLQDVSEIGHQLTERLQVDEVLTLFLAKLTNMLQVDYAYIVEVKPTNQFIVLRYMEHGEKKDVSNLGIFQDKGISGHVLHNNTSLLYKTKKEWTHLSHGFLPDNVESIIAVPVKRNQQIVGVLTLASKQKRAYERFHLMIVDILTNYLAVAVENAKHYEETRIISERCALTKLYNYRYFEKNLEDEFEKLLLYKVRTSLSLILLDIDHFKTVNDTYGHQAGNEVLCQLAERLVENVGNRGTVARYGGEEFAILLPDLDRFTSFQLAESIRLAISTEPFTIQNHLIESKKSLTIHITASIGVASAPEDADDPMTLIRHADRALYTGAKQKGRNKVAQYVK
ncbi:sensor domain-containing diguanylate cyclase [Bacillus sp. DJP31]|uniref:sensor domain-containing diguanylate cyclase n=1 Tax=Bacillus sp. DJP31 TaxID=3409789 RepID=UPI003BB5C6DD